MKEQTQTLIVDDEEGVRFFLEETLRRVGHNTHSVSSGEEALAALRDNAFDLVMLDLRLGGRVDGLRVLEAIRWRWPETAVIILTAHGSLETAIAAIREGVEGYLLKPVEPAELRQAVEDALSRRRQRARAPHVQQERHVLERAPFEIELDKHSVALDGRVLELTSREFKLLVHLVQNAHRVTSPQELVRVVRDYDCEDLYEAQGIIKWYIHRLRRKVEKDPSHPRYILNVRGVGYRFVGAEDSA